MPNRVLFVDDDAMLLSSLRRCLDVQYDLSTATSGPEALRLIEEACDPFPVIVTDMRMPVMNGVEFISRAQGLSPDSVYILLTGNQDAATTAEAVNSGGVERFLVKPCDVSVIAEAIEGCLAKHHAKVAERELLSNTFTGAIGILSDVMETIRPELIARAAQIESFVESIRERCDIADQWEYGLAAKLSLVGLALQPRLPLAPAGSPESLAHLIRSCEASSKMIQRIPRMEKIAQIISAIPTVDGDLPTTEARGEGDVVIIGATLLRVAQFIEELHFMGVDSEEAVRDLRQTLPELYEPVAQAAAETYPLGEATEKVPVLPRDLEPGMVLASNLMRNDGAKLLRSGKRLSETHIEKISAEAANFDEEATVLVTRNSYECSNRADLACGGV